MEEHPFGLTERDLSELREDDPFELFEYELAHKPVRLSDRELLEIFPKEARNYLKQKIKDLYMECQNLEGKKRAAIKEHDDWLLDILEGKRQKLEDEAMKIKWLLKGEESNQNLEVAKRIPISNFLEFTRAGFTKCLWHEERTGSLKYYPKTNHVYCYAGCGKKDVVDVVMQLRNVDFKEAIKILS